MRNFFYIVVFGFVITLAYWAYQENVKTQMAIKKSEEFQIERGMRIAQMVIAPAPQAIFTLVEGLDETSRGTGGFGSTGSE